MRPNRVRMIAAVALLAFATGPARAEVSEVRISHGFGVLYLPLMVMESEKLLEKQAKSAGLGEIKATYVVLDGGNVINDAMLSGALDVASAANPAAAPGGGGSPEAPGTGVGSAAPTPLVPGDTTAAPPGVAANCRL